MSAARLIRPYVRRDDISWWAGIEYDDGTYITETATLTRAGASNKSRRMAANARRLRDREDFGKKITTGGAS